jgi:hypothetical protein
MNYDNNSLIVRYAIWQGHNKKCFYSGELVEFENANIDHIIPKSISKTKLDELKEKLDLDDDFDLNGLENLTLSKSFLNRKKGNSVLIPAELILVLNDSKKKIDRITKLITKYNAETDFAKLMVDLKLSTSSDDIDRVYSILTDEEQFFNDYTNYDDIHGTLLCSQKRIQISANLPTKDKSDTSCAIVFKAVKIRDVVVVLNHDDVIKTLFRNIKTPLEAGLRKFINYNNYNKEYEVVIKNVRLSLSDIEARELCNLVDLYYDKFYSSIKIYESIFKTKRFEKIGNSYKLIRIKWNLWIKLINFAIKHDAASEYISDWNIFDANQYYLKIFTKEHRYYEDGYHAMFDSYNDPTQMSFSRSEFRPDVWITWDPSKTFYGLINENDISNKKHWDCECCYDFLIHQFIPRVIYDDIDHKKVSFDTFISNFSFEDYIDTCIVDYMDINKVNDFEELTSCYIKLQMFMSTSDSIYLKQEEYVGVLMACKEILNATINLPVEYFSGNLGIGNASCKEDILLEMDRRIDDAKTGVYSNFGLDLLFRCPSVALRDFQVDYKRVNVISNVNSLKPLIDFYNLNIYLEKHSKNYA